MSRITIAIASFIAGVCFAFALFSTIQASTRTQTTAQNLKNEPISNVGAEPSVPPLATQVSAGNFKGPLQTLDGLNCDGCSIDVEVVQYGGGAFSCKNCLIRASHGVRLTGAAQNTYNALFFLGVISGHHSKPIPNEPNAPLLAANDLRIVAGKNDWVSLAGLASH